MTNLAVIRWQFDVSSSLLTMNLDRLTDEDCLWEPASNCWSVRRQSDGTWAADWAMPEPDPVPATSIGWVMWHIGFWWQRTYDQCFGEIDPAGEARDWSAVAATTPWPGDVTAAVNWLGECRDRWIAALECLDETALASSERCSWFADGACSLGHVLAWGNIELMNNAAEIGQLRHLHHADRG